MGRSITFDWHPPPSLAVAISRIVVLLAFVAIFPADYVYGDDGARMAYAVAVGLLVLCLLAREAAAILWHTRFSLADLWVIATICGSLAGIMMRLVFEIFNAQKTEPPWEIQWGTTFLIGGLVFIVILRGFYAGLRLTLWLKAEGFRRRTGLLLIGMVGYLAGVAWKVAAALAALPLLMFTTKMKHKEDNWIVLAICVAVILAGLALERIHLPYRRRAQETYAADPEALGKAGRLPSEKTGYYLKDMVDHIASAVLRLLGMPPQKDFTLKKK